jgi:pimeloyl-ACP methyl ester carboxylesterase
MPPDALANMDPPRLAADLAPFFGHDLADQPPIVMPQLNALKHYDATPRLSELAGIPTLLLSGKHDPIARPELARNLAAAIPNPTHHPFSNASHGLPLHLQNETNSLLLAHLHSAHPSP